MPNALLLYPRHPPTYWGHDYALDLMGIRAAFPPLGLLTVAAMFPSRYNLRVVDLNVTPLEDADLEWADLAFTSSMIPQRPSLEQIVGRCNRAQVPVIAGGPHPTTFHEEMEGVDHFVLDEVEETFPTFLRDLENGVAKAVYRATRRPDVTLAPLPRFDLIDLNHYYSMCLQFSRGCPFDCEFCDITKLFGRVPRTKTPRQMLGEFDTLYELGWRGNLFLVDDNFIGNKREALELLPEVAEWQKERRYPFALFTEASVNLARNDELMESMIEAGFDWVFLGIETPNPKALIKTKKAQNTSKKQEEDYLLSAVRTIQRKGMEVSGGFILGLDGDDEGVFDAQIDFIQEAGIPMAMVGLLTALKGTDLYDRLQREDRILEETTGTSVNVVLNYKPEMDPQTLIEGYRRVLTTIYDPTLENYFRRCLNMMEHVKPSPYVSKPVGMNEVRAIGKSLRRQLFSRQGPAYLKFIAKVARDHPRMLTQAFHLAVMGYHFEKVTSQQIAIHDFKEFLEAELDSFTRAVSHSVRAGAEEVEELRVQVQELFSRVHARYEAMHDDLRYGVEDALESFRSSVNAQVDQFARLAVAGA
jgi:radical SAM superfamily enzyme YgiQ (UPF0313 family)